MKRPKQFVFAAVTLLASIWALAAEPTPTAIDELMHKSGLWIQLAEIQPAFAQGMDQALAGMAGADEKAIETLGRALTTAYAPDRLRPVVARQLALSLAAADVDAALQWLSSDLGKRITLLEEKNSTPEALNALKDHGADRVKALPPERLARYEKLARAIHAGEVDATMLIDITAGLARGIHLAMPGAESDDPEAVAAMLESRRPQLVAEMERQRVEVSTMGYASLSDSELDRYIAFAESPAGQRYHAAAAIALDKAMTDAAVEAGRLAAGEKSA